MGKLWRIATVVVLGSIMTVLDTTIVNVALDRLSSDLHTSLDGIQWVVTGYLLALAAVIPVTGWVVARHGAFRVYVVALVLFTAGSALCALAQSAPELIAFRVVQGAGGGMMVPVGQIILVRASTRQELPKVMGAIGVPVVLAPVFGPTLGGLLVQSVGWQWIFLVNVPIGVATVVAALRLLPRDGRDLDRSHPLDWTGLVLGAAGTVGLLFGVSEADGAHSVLAWSVLGPVLAGVAALAAFVRRSRRRAHPLLDLSLYRVAAFRAAALVTVFLGAALFGAMILLPLYYQQGRGFDAVHTGLLLIPQSAGSALGMYLSSWATQRFGAGLTSVAGAVILIAGTVPFLTVGVATPYTLLAPAMVVRGIGVGLAVVPAMTAAFAALADGAVADASPQLTVLQRVGGSLGTAVVAVVLQRRLTAIGAHPAPGAVAAAYAGTYWWVIALAVVALVPTVVLWRAERRASAAPSEVPAGVAALGDVVL